MDNPIFDLQELIRGMDPLLNEGVYVFATLDQDQPVTFDILGSFREEEGVSIIVEEQIAVEAGLRVDFRAAWITLRVHSALAAVGLTAAVSVALADAGIPSNIVAAAHHDHLFVPVEQASTAMTVLTELQTRNPANWQSPAPRDME